MRLVAGFEIEGLLLVSGSKGLVCKEKLNPLGTELSFPGGCKSLDQTKQECRRSCLQGETLI